MSIPTSCLPRKITIADGRSVSLQAPTVRQVVEVLHVMQNMEDQDDRQLLFELLRGLDWRHCADIGVQLRNLYDSRPRKFVTFVQDILLQGYDPKEQTQKNNKSGTVTKPNWSLLIAEVTRTSGSDAFEIYNKWPFPFFMEWLSEARKEEAKRHISRATEAMFAMGGSQKIMDSWQEQAGWGERESNKYDEELSDEQINENLDRLKNRLRQ